MLEFTIKFTVRKCLAFSLTLFVPEFLSKHQINETMIRISRPRVFLDTSGFKNSHLQRRAVHYFSEKVKIDLTLLSHSGVSGFLIWGEFGRWLVHFRRFTFLIVGEWFLIRRWLNRWNISESFQSRNLLARLPTKKLVCQQKKKLYFPSL